MSTKTGLPPFGHAIRPLESVVIGTSLGEESDEVVRIGLAVAQRASARIHLVHAVQSEPHTLGFEAGVMQERVDGCREQLRRQVERLGLGEPELASSRVIVGVPHRVLIEAAKEAQGDLIVVGATGAGPFAAELLGSTADRVLRKATCPVLIARAPLPIPPQHVLAPVDLSKLSAEALYSGLHLLAHLCGSQAVEVRVVYAQSFFDALALRQRTGEGCTIEQARRSAADELRRFVLENRPERPFEVETEVLAGEARSEILRELGEHPADLLVMGTHGCSGFDRLVPGSVFSSVVRKAPCSVLAISPDAALAEGIAEAIESQTSPASWEVKPSLSH